MECGIDIVKIERFEKHQNDEGFLNKYFSKKEIEYFNQKHNSYNTLAGLYASKEAFLKCLGIGIGGGLRLNEITVLHQKNGKPEIEITPQIMFYLNQQNCTTVSLSISHDGDYAVAFCVIE